MLNANAIYSQYDLAHFRDLVNNNNQLTNAKLMENISLSNVCSSTVESWNSIGDANSNINYSGIFDGNNNTIENLYINNSIKYQGLFGRNKGTIKNLNLESGYIYSTTTHIGLVCGENIGNINNVTSKGEIIAFKAVGGIIGRNKGIVELCNNYASVTNNKSINLADGEFSNIGGIAGVNENIIRDCNNYANVSGIIKIGGIVGMNYSDNTSSKFLIENCSNNGEISGKRFVGGISGSTYNLAGNIKNCVNNSSISVTSNRVAGILGGVEEASAGGVNIYNCVNKGKIEGNNACGGILAIAFRNTDIYACKNEGEVCGNMNAVGGILARAGYLDANVCTIKVRQCANKGYIHITPTTTEAYCGGILGAVLENDNIIINNCYNRGNISLESSGTEEAFASGGILGVVSTSLTGTVNITNCYDTGNISNLARPGRAGVIIGYDPDNKRTNSNNYYLETINGKNTLSGKPLDDLSLKNAVSKLGSGYKNDDNNKNDGYPILVWE